MNELKSISAHSDQDRERIERGEASFNEIRSEYGLPEFQDKAAGEKLVKLN